MFYGAYSFKEEIHPRSVYTSVKETDDFEDVLALYPANETMIASIDHLWQSSEREAIAGSFIQLGIITHQAKTFGFVPDSIDSALFLPGKGTGVEDKHLFDNLIDRGYTVLFDNTFGYDAIAAVKDSYLISSYSSNGRTLIGKSPVTRRITELCCERMAIDACKVFADAVSGKQHNYRNEGIAVQNYADIIEIATLKHRTWDKKAEHNEVIEFDDVAEDYDFLKRVVKSSSETEQGKITSEVEDLAKIWENHLLQRRLSFEWDDDIKEYKDLIIETANDIGINSSVEAYYEGVPVNDILA